MREEGDGMEQGGDDDRGVLGVVGSSLTIHWSGV